MPPTEVPTNTPSDPVSNKKHIPVGLIMVSVLLIVSLVLLFLTYQKNSSLKDELKVSQDQLSASQGESKKLAFSPHPEQDYSSFRNAAYAELMQKTFPDEKFDVNQIALLRVYNATSFRNAGDFFAKIQNDDIVIYDQRMYRERTEIPTAIVRPREQKVIEQAVIKRELIDKARSDNITKSPLGYMRQNLYSQQ